MNRKEMISKIAIFILNETLLLLFILIRVLIFINREKLQQLRKLH